MLKKKIEFLLRSFNFKAFIFAVTKTLSHTDLGNREKAQLVFDWGKYHEREGKFMILFAVQVHHAFVDGIILANFRINYRDTWRKCRLIMGGPVVH